MSLELLSGKMHCKNRLCEAPVEAKAANSGVGVAQNSFSVLFAPIYTQKSCFICFMALFLQPQIKMPHFSL
jgi:hypothetical protein